MKCLVVQNVMDVFLRLKKLWLNVGGSISTVSDVLHVKNCWIVQISMTDKKEEFSAKLVIGN
jgi:hypothetical protein